MYGNPTPDRGGATKYTYSFKVGEDVHLLGGGGLGYLMFWFTVGNSIGFQATNPANTTLTNTIIVESDCVTTRTSFPTKP